MEQYNVTGMSCAACSARVEKAVSKVPGVTSCSVSLLTNSMGVEGTAAPADIVAAVEAAGYGASPKNAAAQSAAPSADALKDTETPRLKRRLIASLIFWVVLMYFSMGHMPVSYTHLDVYKRQDRNSIALANLTVSTTSLSARRAWIEIGALLVAPLLAVVALRKESVDRNSIALANLTVSTSRSPQGERG